MAGTSDLVNYKWYRYTTDGGTYRAVRVDKTIGDHADFGFAAFDPDDVKLMNRNRLERPRAIVVQNATTFRRRMLVVGSDSCNAWTTTGYSVNLPMRGLTDVQAFTKIYNVGEHITAPAAIYETPEVTVA